METFEADNVIKLEGETTMEADRELEDRLKKKPDMVFKLRPELDGKLAFKLGDMILELDD